MNEDLRLDYDAFLRSFKRNTDVTHSILLGAGASISSGIQSAYDCIWEWKKDIYTSKNINSSKFYSNFKDDSVRKSIQKWLDAQGEYPELDSNEEYSFYAQKAYPIDEDRRKYFLSLIENKEPYVGYKLLCLLASKNIVSSVWTTNFDGLMVRAAHQNNLIPIEVTLDNADKILRNQSTKEIITIALHGDFKFKTLKNTSKELDSQNEIFIDHLSNYHIDKNLIIIGYSGRDQSLMLAIHSAFKRKGSGRLYWCGYGNSISKEVQDLLSEIRQAGREAYFVSTDGFDKTIIHLTKSAFEGDDILSQDLENILQLSKDDEFLRTEFSLNSGKTGKYIKSNLHPIVFPKEVFRFELDFKNERPWKFLKTKTKNTNVVAVPFKRMVYAIGTLSEISTLFNDHLSRDIKREPISIKDVENVTNFRNLMLQAVVKHFSRDNKISSNGKNRLWLNDKLSEHRSIKIHSSVYLSLYFDKNTRFAYLSFSPSVQLTSENEIQKIDRQRISKFHLEKLYNNKYDKFLSNWNKTLFRSNQIKFEFPHNSGSGLEFMISSNTAYGEIFVHDPNFRIYKPNEYDSRKTQFKGVQFLEPQLVFKNLSTENDFKDYHPMRGLVKNRPYDVNLNGVIHSKEINLSVICGSNYSSIFYDFLSQIHVKQPTQNINPDYLIDYPGFTSTYNIPLNIPNYENDDNWIDIKFIGDNTKETHVNAIALARTITSKIDQIFNSQGTRTIVIFIPEEWQPFESFVTEEESFDLHDYIKAFSASKGIATQLIREKTLSDNLKCQIYWWLSLSFYVKSLRTPWIINNPNVNTAYAGIGYSISYIKGKPEIVIGCSHIYDSNGQGLKYRLSKIDDYYLDKQNNPYMSYKDAFQFGVSIRELFYQSLDRLPERVVIHKRTKFTEDEINGIKSSLKKAGIHKIDLIEISYEVDARFMAMNVYKSEIQIDKFPISRGTCIVTNKQTALLWTHGIVPSVRQPNYKFYLGGRSIPAPIKITKHHGDSNIDTIASEILGLTKMNWNSLDLYSKLPTTIDSSNKIARIGKLLSRFEGRTYDYRLFI